MVNKGAMFLPRVSPTLGKSSTQDPPLDNKQRSGVVWGYRTGLWRLIQEESVDGEQRQQPRGERGWGHSLRWS
jgi:hypothetical protein